MRKGSFLVLLAATIVMVAAAVVATLRGDRAVAPPAGARLVFPTLAAHLGDLAWIRLSHGTMNADFTSIAGRWVVVEKGNYPAAPDRMRRLLVGLADLALVEPKTDRPALYGRLGLDDPPQGAARLVELQDRTGTTVVKLLIGKTRPDRLGGGNDGVYVRLPGDPRTWLARGSLDLPGHIGTWLDRRLLDIPPGRIQSVTLTAADGAALTLRRDPNGGRFAVADPPADAKFKAQAALAAPAAALDGLELDDVRPTADLPVPQSGVARAAFATYDGLTITLRLLNQGHTEWAAIAAAGTGKTAVEAAAINARVARWTYALPAAPAKLLHTKLGDLVEPAKGS
jgi:hypothetical protein